MGASTDLNGFTRRQASSEGTSPERQAWGQTEHGSFVVTLLAPVPPLLQPKLDPSWASPADEPMERLVTRRLMQALEASRTAAEMALSGDAKAFEDAVNAGVSANLC